MSKNNYRKFGKCKRCGKKRKIQAKKMCCSCYNTTHFGLEYFRQKQIERKKTHWAEMKAYQKE